jgi:hypothetical protein
MESLMKLTKMRTQVKEEMNNIPRGDLNQNMFRQAYWSLRLHSLGKKAKNEESKEDVLVKAVGIVRHSNKEFSPKFNDNFFDLKAIRNASRNDKDLFSCFR